VSALIDVRRRRTRAASSRTPCLHVQSQVALVCLHQVSDGIHTARHFQVQSRQGLDGVVQARLEAIGIGNDHSLPVEGDLDLKCVRMCRLYKRLNIESSNAFVELSMVQQVSVSGRRG